MYLFRSFLFYSIACLETLILSPIRIGSSSSYVIHWMIPMMAFLASWYSRSSSQWELILPNSRAKLLCIRRNITWTGVRKVFWLARMSPASKTKVSQMKRCRYHLYCIFRGEKRRKKKHLGVTIYSVIFKLCWI